MADGEFDNLTVNNILNFDDVPVFRSGTKELSIGDAKPIQDFWTVENYIPNSAPEDDSGWGFGGGTSHGFTTDHKLFGQVQCTWLLTSKTRGTVTF